MFICTAHKTTTGHTMHTMHNLFGFLYAAFIQFLGAGIPLFIMACIKKSLKPFIAAVLLLLFYSIDTIALHISHFISLFHFHWNFEGKAIELLLPFIMIYGFGFLSPEAIGLKWPRRNSQLLLGTGLGTLFALGVFTTETILHLLPKQVDAETMIFEFTLPGFSEEILYRGFLLALLKHYIGIERNFFNFRCGWGIVFVSILFILMHLVNYDPTQRAIVWSEDLWTIGNLFVISFILGFLREKTDSIWPCILCHNFANGLYFLGALYIVG